MEQNYIKAINLYKGAYNDCCKRTYKVLRHAAEVFRLCKKEEYTPLYDANFLEIANPYEPKTSKMIEAILKYKQDGEFILFKSFARRFLCPLGFNEKWIENPNIHAEKEHMDIRILDKEKKQYAVFFENKLKGAPFQRNQIARYIQKLIDNNYNKIYIVLLPGHINSNFINEIPISVWRFHQKKHDTTECANKGNKTTCWCDDDRTKKKCPEYIRDSCTKDYFEKYSSNTISIDKTFVEWLILASGKVESKQTILIDSMVLFANYIKKIYNMTYPDKLIMEIKNYLKQTIFEDDLTAAKKLEIAEQELSNVDAVHETLKSMVAELKVDVWYNRLQIKWSKIKREANCFYIPIKEVKVGYWDGTIDNNNTPYWGFQCSNPLSEQKNMVKKILKELNIKPNKHTTPGFLVWANWDENDLKEDEICDAIYKKAKELGYWVEE